MDVLNVNGRARDFVLTGAGKSEVEDLAKPLVAAEGRTISPEEHPERGGYYRSDHFSFAKLGVPMLDAGSRAKTSSMGGKAAGARATRWPRITSLNRYHKPQDEYDPNVELGRARSQDLTVYYGLGRKLADDTNLWPNWYKTAEFRGIRDRSRASAQ